MNKIIANKLKALPDKPGVYIMRDNLNNIIYVGKAKILKNRVRQYFRKSTNHSDKVKKMVENIYDLNWIVTDSEMEALILECNLIKRHMPKYNILLKDDKTYPFIKVTLSEDYPRVLMVRKVDNKSDKFFGPYTSSFAVKKTVDLLRKTYGIRSCNRDLSKIATKRECLNYHINQCTSPCMGYISKEDYRKRVDKVIDFLSGKSDDILKMLYEKMQKLSDNMQYEAAADVRDSIFYVKKITERQKISVPDGAEYDIIGYYDDENTICITPMFVRNGKLLGSKNIYFPISDNKEEILYDFLKQFYDDKDRIPKEILIPFEPTEFDLLKELLNVRRNANTEIRVPKIGMKKDLLYLAIKNAKEGLSQKKGGKYLNAVNELKDLLNLETVPERIEVYDISHTGGSDIVGFMTVFENGLPKKSEYRKFKIKYTETADDYLSMFEVIYRRLTHALEDRIKLDQGEDYDKLKFIKLPDLIFVDGGKGQVKAGKQAVMKAGLSIDVFGLVKDDKHRTRDITSEIKEYKAFENRAVFNMVARMQDETHNNAVNYHHTLRTKNIIKSELQLIEGVGKITEDKLFKEFKTIDNIKNAGVKELSKVVRKDLAEKIYNHFKM